MGKGVFRSLNAIILGWAAVFGGYLRAITAGHLVAPLLNRYTIAAQLPLLPSILMGGWLRARQVAHSEANH